MRKYWLDKMLKIADPIIKNLSEGTLDCSIPKSFHPERERYILLDSFGRTTSTSVAGQTLISHSYNANSTINTSTYGNGDSVSYAYDTLDRVTSLSYNDVKTYEYDYNREGQVAREKDYDNNITTSMNMTLISDLRVLIFQTVFAPIIPMTA